MRRRNDIIASERFDFSLISFFPRQRQEVEDRRGRERWDGIEGVEGEKEDSDGKKTKPKQVKGCCFVLDGHHFRSISRWKKVGKNSCTK